MPPPDSRRLGIALVLLSAVLWSTAGVFVRMAELDIWSVVAWRSGFTAVILGLYLVARRRLERRRPLRSFGWPGVVSTAVAVVGAIAYVASLTWTSVANVMTVYAALPFLATAVAFVWLGERVSLRFLVAGAIACGGIALTIGAAIAPRDLLGIGTAFVMTLSFALQLVIAKRHPLLDTTLMLALTTIVCTLIALPFMRWSVPEPTQLLACAGYGLLATGLGYVLVLIGGRMIGSGEASLLSMLDVVLGPLWVWLIFDERIGLATGIGGAAVLVAVVWYLSGATAAPASKAAGLA